MIPWAVVHSAINKYNTYMHNTIQSTSLKIMQKRALQLVRKRSL